MFMKSLCCLLVALSQIFLVKTSDIPRGLIRASDVYVLPWTPAAEKVPFPNDNGGDGHGSRACTLGISCKIGDKIVESSIKDITGSTGRPGLTGLDGLQGPPGPPGPPGCRVAFSVALESKYYGYVGEDVPLRFDKVIMNKGNAFDVENGAFTAPSNGTFVFHVTVGSQASRKGAAQLHLNGKFMATIWAESIKGWGSASNRFVLDMVTGDILRIKVVKRAPYLRDELYTSMTGWCM